MQQAPPITRPASPLTVPHAFRRTTGAHAIIASILFADLLGVLIWVLIGAFSGPPMWWLLRAFLHLLHASLGSISSSSWCWGVSPVVSSWSPGSSLAHSWC